MTHGKQWLTLLAAGTLALGMATAASADDLDVTMDVVEEDGTEETLVNRLELPETADEQGRESSQFGLDTANDARERGRDFGQDRAEAARERGAEARERGMDARDARESARERASDAASRGRQQPD